MSIIDFHLIGGLPWMVLLSLVLLVILALIIYSFIQKENFSPKWFEAIKQLGVFALAFGAFSTLVAFFQAFSDLEQMQEQLPFNVIMGGLKVALITVLYGFGIFLFSQSALIILKFMNRQKGN